MINRREFVGAFAITAVAGCTGSDGGDGANGGDEDTPSPTAIPTTGGPTEVPTTEAPPANFKIAEIEVPDRAEINEEFRANVKVENTGGEDGTFTSSVSARTSESTSWQEAGSIELDVPAGDTAVYESKVISYPFMTKLTYRIDATGDTFTVQIVSARRAFREPYITPDSIQFTTLRIDFQDSYQWSGSSGTTYTEQAPSGQKYAFVYVRAENTGGQPAMSPFAGDVVLLSGDQQFEYEFILKDEGEYESAELQPGVVREGWIAYVVPDDLSLNDITVVWSESTFSGDVAVYWSESGE